MYGKWEGRVWYGPPVLAPPSRLLSVAAVGTAGLTLAAGAAATSPEQQRRSAVLGLYSLDAQLAERKLAARIRLLYDHGSTNALEVILAGTSLREVLNELDTLDRVTTLDRRLLFDLRAARLRERRAALALAARSARLDAAIDAAAAESQRLRELRAERVAFIERLSAREARRARLEAQAHAAQVKSAELTRHRVAATLAPPRTTQSSGGELTVVATGYCLTGRTSSGIPAGWGVAAVDPRVIPLGTRLTIPGYGEAIAADTGSSIVGGRIDLWFPSCARAGGWGSRSVTIDLH
jgi:3D (Asp-Asp-Asp) domain-containing protein